MVTQIMLADRAIKGWGWFSIGWSRKNNQEENIRLAKVDRQVDQKLPFFLSLIFCLVENHISRYHFAIETISLLLHHCC